MIPEKDEGYQVRAVRRALGILMTFGPEHSALSLSELAETLRLHKSTLIRLLSCMESMGFIERDPYNSKYRLGIRNYEVGSNYYLANLNIDRVARIFMEELVDEWNLTANLAVLDGNDIVYVGIVEPHRALRVNQSIGSRFQIHCTALGKAMLAHVDEETRERIIDEIELMVHTPNTITCPERLRADLAETQERGYALDDEEAIKGARCVGVPIVGRDGLVYGALSLSGTVVDVTPDNWDDIAQTMIEATGKIVTKLGTPMINGVQHG